MHNSATICHPNSGLPHAVLAMQFGGEQFHTCLQVLGSSCAGLCVLTQGKTIASYLRVILILIVDACWWMVRRLVNDCLLWWLSFPTHYHDCWRMFMTTFNVRWWWRLFMNVDNNTWWMINNDGRLRLLTIVYQRRLSAPAPLLLAANIAGKGCDVDAFVYILLLWTCLHVFIKLT